MNLLTGPWSNFGTITESFEIEYMNPYHHGYPAWPGGERHLKLLKTNWGTELIFTEGLASADRSPASELYLETNEEVDPFDSSWQANLVYEAGRIIPNVTDLHKRFAENTCLTLQVAMDGAPDEWSLDHADGNIGLFLGLVSEQLASATFPFVPVNIKLMRPDELNYVLKNGAEARIRLAALYAQQGGKTLSFMGRASVV